MGDLVVPALSQDEARSLTDEIRMDAERLWGKLLEAYEGGAHTALGYSSWGSYFDAEFGGGQSQSYRLLDAGRVLLVLDGVTPQLGNEAQARELTPLLNAPETLRDAWREASANGEPTAVQVRDVVQSRMDVHYSSETPEWSTPQDLFDQLDTEFNFTIDVCATASNAKCEQYFTQEEDGLSRPWGGVCWMNPPYGDVISAWVSKAHASTLDGRHTVVCLLPARVDTGWWWDHCRYGEIRFLRGRLKFGGGENSAPFPSAVVIFGREPRVIWWER